MSPDTGFESFLISSTATSTALSIPRLIAIGFAPAVTALTPSRKIACARMVAVVVPSPATSEVLDATSRTIWAPMFVVWAWLLARFRFSPGSVFLLFGINGVLAELLIGGPALVMAPFWI